jgi:hypothetical protein
MDGLSDAELEGSDPDCPGVGTMRVVPESSASRLDDPDEPVPLDAELEP